MQKKKTEHTIEPVLAEIGITLRRQNSLGYIFLHGIVRGMGTALGATLLVAAATSLTLYFAESEQTGTFLRYLMRTIGE